MKIEMADDVIWRDLVDEVLILNLTDGTYFGLEGVGGDMWRLLAEHGSTEKTVELMCSQFDAEPAQVERDVEELVNALAAKKLIRLA